jgi:arabinofuranosyltransferase
VKADPVSVRRTRSSLIALALACFLFIIARDSWLSDDAYITLRTVDNFIHGYGLTWNVDERVQVYTHPLWMWLLSALYFCTHEMYYSVLVLSLILSVLAVGLVAVYLARSLALGLLAILLLAASKAFVDYSTSGLENPLTHLLLVLFLLVYFSERWGRHRLFYLALLAALATVNRMDTVLLYLPALVYSFCQSPGWKRLGAVLLGFVPLVVWEGFALWYYGFLFPNTAYAKLDTGIGTAQLLAQGVGYLTSSVKFDPLLCIVMAAGFVLTIAGRQWRHVSLLVGVALYLLYVLKIGGDFMAGRFLTAPYLLMVVLLVRHRWPGWQGMWVPALVGIALCCGVLVPNSRWYPFYTSPVLVDARGIADERAVYVDATGIATALRGVQVPASPYAQAGVQSRVSHQKVLVVLNRVGFLGYTAGPSVHIVDLPALSEPLLARLPAEPNWRIGHFHRQIPAGYLATLASGKNVIHNRALGLYYEKLHEIIAGPLFDGQRLVEILKFNAGAYNDLLSQYLRQADHPGSPPMTTMPSYRITNFFLNANVTYLSPDLWIKRVITERQEVAGTYP